MERRERPLASEKGPEGLVEERSSFNAPKGLLSVSNRGTQRQYEGEEEEEVLEEVEEEAEREGNVNEAGE